MRAGKVPAVFPSKALIAIAGSIVTAASVEAVVGTDELRAVKPCPRLVAYTFVIHTAPPAEAVAWAVA